MKFLRINPVFGVFPSVFCALILGACGEDTSVDFEQYQESGPYCHVSHSSSKAVLDMFYPDELKAKIEVLYNGKKVVSKLEESFYEGYNLDIDSLCASKAQTAHYDPETFQCDHSGMSYTITSNAEGVSDVMESVVDKLNEQCEEFEEKTKRWGLSAFRMNQSSARSSSSGKSSAKSSSSAKLSSSGVSSSSIEGLSSSVVDQLPRTKIIKTGSNNGFTDKRDGNVYRVVQVGNHVWMLDNLRFEGNDKYPLAGKTFCKGICNGLLYDFAAAMNDKSCDQSFCNEDDDLVQGACPEGWVLPNQLEWDYLKEYLEDPKEFFVNPTGEWNGYCSNDGVSRYWTSSEDTEKSGIEYYYIHEIIRRQGYAKTMGYGIRCVATKDVTLDAVFSFSSSSEASSSSSSFVSSSSVLSSSSMKSLVRGKRDLPVTTIITNGNKNAITDERDGKVYRVMQVGDHVWMVDNLGYVGDEDYPLDGEVYCKEGCSGLQGALYNYAAAMNYEACANKMCNAEDLIVQGACPEGWGVPRASDWTDLQMSLEDASAFFPNPTGEWMSSWRDDDISRFWTSTEQNALGAYEYYYSGVSIASQTYAKSSGYGVRCVALEDVTPDTFKASPSGKSSSSTVEPGSSSSSEPELGSSSESSSSSESL